MKYYFLITGILCLLYYLVLVWHSRKLRSTFAVFWLFAGGAHLIIGCAPLPAYMYTFLSAVCGTGWICLLLVEIMIFSAMFSGKERIVDCIIVLGAQVKEFKKASILTPIFMILEVIMETVIPLLMASIIDDGVEAGNMQHIYTVER